MANAAVYFSEDRRGSNIVQFPIKKEESPFLVEAKERHDAEPVESTEEIDKIVLYCLTNEKWRDALLFVMGFNFGVRVSDLRRLQFKHLFHNDKLVDHYDFNEKKTHKDQTVYVNQAVREMLEIYIQKTSVVTPEMFVFTSQSRHKKLIESNGVMVTAAMSRQAIDRMIKTTMEAVGIPGRYATHTLRKTPGFQIEQSPSLYGDIENSAAIQGLMLFYGHSSIQSTFHYTGYAKKKRREMFMNLNLGLGAIRKFKERETYSDAIANQQLDAERKAQTTHGGTKIGSIGSNYLN